MKRERDIAHKVVAEINGYKIIRSEAKTEDRWTEELSGQTKIYYDVCDEEDLLASFKTLREAKRFCNE